MKKTEMQSKKWSIYGEKIHISLHTFVVNYIYKDVMYLGLTLYVRTRMVTYTTNEKTELQN
jgi:hypothetical protein